MNKIKVKASTIIRTILQIVVYLNQIAAIICQALDVTDNLIYLIISTIFTIIITTITYWYNNDWSGLAKATGEIFDMVKDGKITKDELQEFLDKYSNNKKEK